MVQFTCPQCKKEYSPEMPRGQGTPEQREQWLTHICSTECWNAYLGIEEPEANSANVERAQLISEKVHQCTHAIWEIMRELSEREDATLEIGMATLVAVVFGKHMETVWSTGGLDLTKEHLHKISGLLSAQFAQDEIPLEVTFKAKEV